jgi:hypothetical protein
MPTRSSVRVTALTVVSLTSGTALAQPPAPPSPAAAWGQSAANISGMVRSFELTPAGDLEGFILADGTEVHLPPHLTQQLAGAVHVDDRVEVRGWRSTVPNFVVGTSVTNIGGGQTVVDQGPSPPGVMPPPLPPGRPASGAQWGQVQGRVQQDLHGPAGDINGAVLDNGTELKLPPPAAFQVSGWLQPGQIVVAQGYMLTNAFGRVMDVQSIGPSEDRLAQVGWATPPGIGRAPPPPPPPPAPAH